MFYQLCFASVVLRVVKSNVDGPLARCLTDSCLVSTASVMWSWGIIWQSLRPTPLFGSILADRVIIPSGHPSWLPVLSTLGKWSQEPCVVLGSSARRVRDWLMKESKICGTMDRNVFVHKSYCSKLPCLEWQCPEPCLVNVNDLLVMLCTIAKPRAGNEYFWKLSNSKIVAGNVPSIILFAFNLHFFHLFMNAMENVNFVNSNGWLGDVPTGSWD